jgi:hypothetical protein
MFIVSWSRLEVLGYLSLGLPRRPSIIRQASLPLLARQTSNKRASVTFPFFFALGNSPEYRSGCAIDSRVRLSRAVPSARGKNADNASMEYYVDGSL